MLYKASIIATARLGLPQKTNPRSPAPFVFRKVKGTAVQNANKITLQFSVNYDLDQKLA